ncbi:MAG TPA: fumarylacetoacetase [Gemmatimonadales bacterium]|nr:fumarylacetoacetase [Gemmatimonadales bacterium]
MTDATHELALRSWVESANSRDTDFPIQNLPFGVFRTRTDPTPRIGVAIGDQILDLAGAGARGLLAGLSEAALAACRAPVLNALFALPALERAALRRQLSRLLQSGEGAGRSGAEALLVAAGSAELLLPATIGDYTDFYASIDHATNVGKMFRPDNPLLPNYKWIPIGYHGRASSIVVSGTPVHRPSGQRKDPAAEQPTFGASRLLDYELELGAFVGTGNPLGTTVPLGEADQRLAGFCLLNDWSARDIQSWEYQPLGPFLGKSFATTISPWVVTREALEPFRRPRAVRPEGDPPPIAELESPVDRERGAYGITLEVWLTTPRMRADGAAPFMVSRSDFARLYWTMGQMLAHHTSNGCNLRTGDLLGSGTVSGPTPDSRGCLLERTWRGSEPLALPNGESRKFLEDGDEVIFRGYAEAPGRVPIGFGECRGVIVG